MISVNDHLERFHRFLDYERHEFESTMRYINARDEGNVAREDEENVAGVAEPLQHMAEQQQQQDESADVVFVAGQQEEPEQQQQPEDRLVVRTFLNRIRRNNHQRTNQIGLKCPICLANFSEQPLFSTTCGHIFCANCIVMWFIYENRARDLNLPPEQRINREWNTSSCAYCRGEIMLLECIQIFLN